MSNNLGVRRPTFFRSPSDTVVEMNGVYERRHMVPTLSSLAHMDYRRHTNLKAQDYVEPGARRESLPRFQATLSDSRRETLVLQPPASPTYSEADSFRGGPLDTTPRAVIENPFVTRRPGLSPQQSYHSAYTPTYTPQVESPPLWQTLATGTWGRVRRQSRDAVVVAGLVTLALWNALLTVRVFRVGQPTVYNDRQLEDALIALDRAPPWRNEL